MCARTSRLLVLFAGLCLTAAATAGPLGWAREKITGKPEAPKTGVVTARPGAVTMLANQPTRLPIDYGAPEAELPKGRSYFRRIELSQPLDEALIEVRVIAQDAGGKQRTVFKPLFYLLDDDGGVRETVDVDPLNIDIRPFQPTALVGCVKVGRLSRFLVATTEKAIGGHFESGSRSPVKAASKGGFYYSTEAVKVKLPYAATGELVLTVSPITSRRCEPATAADAKDAKSDKSAKPEKTADAKQGAAR